MKYVIIGVVNRKNPTSCDTLYLLFKQILSIVQPPSQGVLPSHRACGIKKARSPGNEVDLSRVSVAIMDFHFF